MSAHTPSPWHIGGSTGYWYQTQIEPSIGCVYGNADEPGEPRANALLIAAAPDLLEALREVLAVSRAGVCVPDTVYGAERQLDRIRAAAAKAEAAIAKATGEEV